MITDSRQENAEEPDIWIRLAKDNLAAWMLNWMTSTSLEVISANILGACSIVKPELNKASFAILPDQLKDVPDVSKYVLKRYWPSRRIMHASLFYPASLQLIVEHMALQLEAVYALGNVVQGSVRGVMQDLGTELEMTIYYVKKED